MNKKKAIEYPGGLYVTASQCAVFLGHNKPNYKQSYVKEFQLYCTNCACYNLLSDLQEKYPDEIDFIWHSAQKTFGFTFSSDSNVAIELEKLGILDELEEEDCEVLF